jgi:hypothetical protein
MQPTPSAEHFVTLFNSSFLPQGLALAGSLAEHCPRARLWVLCMDEAVQENLKAIGPPNVEIIPLHEIEDHRLLAAKSNRTTREYCWTLAAFTFDAVFARCRDARRVTYLDADLFFFSSPNRMFDELESTGAAVLITEHNFDPEYDRAGTVGKFCVQFLTMDRSARAEGVRSWWQARVLEWCYDRIEPDRFGDQKYLDRWPELFSGTIHVLRQKELALAPWNVRMEALRSGGILSPSFYHFHSFRLVSKAKARALEGGYALPVPARRLYVTYQKAISLAVRRMTAGGIELSPQPVPRKPLYGLRHVVKMILGRADTFVRI